jgi:TolA-binding protein
VALIISPAATRAQEGRRAAEGDAARRVPEGLRFAHGLFRQRKFELAAIEYQKFLDTRPEPSEADEARFGLASAQLFQGRYKEARQAFQEFLDQAPDHARARTARYRLGELSYLLGDLPAARKSLELFVSGKGKHANLETAWGYLGDVRLGLNDLAGARAAYERSLADFPRGPLADRSRYGLGRTLSALGETDLAVKVLSDLANHGGSDWVDRAWLQLGKIQLAAGRPAAAVESLEALDRLAPRSALKPEGHLLRAEALTGLGRTASAVELLEPLVAEGAEPVAPRAALALATIELQSGAAERALARLELAATRFPRSPLVPAILFRSAEALDSLKRFDQARKRFLKAAELAPADPWADDAIARGAQLALETGDHSGALALARSFPQRFPVSPLIPEVRLTEARALLAGGEAREAATILEALAGDGNEQGPEGKDKAQSPRLSPAALTAARYDLALAYRASGQPERARSLLAKLAGATKDPIGSDAQFLIGQDAVEKGQFAQAISPLQHYLENCPQGEVADTALAHLVTAQLGLKQLNDAWNSLSELERRFPRSQVLASCRLRWAEAALQAGEPERAAEQFRLVLSPTPDAVKKSTEPAAIAPLFEARARVGLGRALWKLGKPADAATQFAQFLDRFKSDAMAPAVALDRAGALAAAERSVEALEAYDRVLARYPGTRQALGAELARARLLARTGHAEDAAKALERLLADASRRTELEAAGEHRDALLAERGWALIEAGKNDAADAVFSELLTTFPESPHAVEARFNLAESASQNHDLEKVVRLLGPVAAAKAPDGSSGEAGSQRQGGGLSLASPPAPIMALVLYRLGRTQFELGDHGAAGRTLERLIKEHPGSARIREARFLRAEAALRQDQAESAEPIFAALESEPPSSTDPDGFGLLVRARHVQSLVGIKRWNEALTRADSLKKELPPTDPNGAELDFARGRAFLGLGRPDEAREAFQAVIRAREGSDLAAQAQFLRGETFFHQERFHEARTEFLKVDILYDAPRWQAAALLEAGKVDERLGQWSDAVETYQRLCTRFPQDPRVTLATARLVEARKRASAQRESAGKLF